MNDYDFSVKKNILKIKPKEEVDIETLKQYKEEIEKSTGKIHNYIIYTNCIGYHTGYDFLKDKSIYIGTLSESRAFSEMQKYVENESINN